MVSTTWVIIHQSRNREQLFFFFSEKNDWKKEPQKAALWELYCSSNILEVPTMWLFLKQVLVSSCKIRSESQDRKLALFPPQIQIKRRLLFENTYACNKNIGFLAIYIINSGSFYALFHTTRGIFISFWYYKTTYVYCGKSWKFLVTSTTSK